MVLVLASGYSGQQIKGVANGEVRCYWCSYWGVVVGMKESLIVAVVTAIVLYAWVDGAGYGQKHLSRDQRHDIAHDWCTQSVKARDLCASWKVEPMDGKGK
jgi:hypothetical protein